VAADAVLANQRATTWVAGTSLPVVAPPSNRPNTIEFRTQAAGTSIAYFDAAFYSTNGNNNNADSNTTGNGANN